MPKVLDRINITQMALSVLTQVALLSSYQLLTRIIFLISLAMLSLKAVRDLYN